MYRIFDLALDSDIPLPELAQVASAPEVIRVQEQPRPVATPVQPAWVQHWTDPRGNTYFSCGKLDDGWLLRWPGLVDFAVDITRQRIRYTRLADIPAETLRHLLLDQVVPRMLGQAGRLVLHASAVQTPDGNCLLFVGDSGRGKSTLAAALQARGCTLLTDDCLMLSRHAGALHAIPSYAGVRLKEDSAECLLGDQFTAIAPDPWTKKRRLIHAPANGPGTVPSYPLGGIYLLEDPAASHEVHGVVEKTVGSLEFLYLLGASFILDPGDKALLTAQFRLAGEISRAVKRLRSLQYPRRYSFLPTLVNHLLQDTPACTTGAGD